MAENETNGLNKLPEDCIASILSFTSPQASCRLSQVSPEFNSASNYDTVWGSFLPHDYEDIIKRSSFSSLFEHSSKKQVFRRLCDSILIDGGTKSFALEKSGRKSYMLSARELYISQVDDQNHWTWKYIPQSRFEKVVELKTISNLEIEGRIKSEILSPNTKYGAYLIMKLSNKSFGLNSIPSQMSLKIGDLEVKRAAYLCGENVKQQKMEGLFYKNRSEMMNDRLKQEGFIYEENEARERGDGWMEIEIGEFFIGCDHSNGEDVKMRLSEVKGHQLKGGLIIEGIQVRPK